LKLPSFSLFVPHVYRAMALSSTVLLLLAVQCAAQNQTVEGTLSTAREVAPVPRLSTVERVTVREFRFEGNTVFTQAQLAKLMAPYLNREISAEELEEARRQLTLHYVNSGFINSGALLKEQPVRDGTITFTIIEGTLTDIKVTGNRHYRTDYLVEQVSRGVGPPFNLTAARNTLQVLRQNPNISRINAEVQPGVRPGAASLNVAVQEANPYRIALEFDNHRPASIGAERLRLVTSSSNLTGRDDALFLRTGLTRNGLRQSALSGQHDLSLTYQSPPSRDNTSFQFNYSKGDAAVIEEPFRTLDISSRSENAGIGLRLVPRRTITSEFALTLNLEHRQSTAFLAGQPFSFARGDVNGKAQTTALRFGQEWLRRGQTQVFTARTLVSWGGNFQGSTHNALAPNGSFLTLLGQTQYVRLLNNSGRQLILRLSGQWANRPLLSVEQFAVGGANSVRGYRENQLVRDRGLVTSAEMRVPVLLDRSGRERLSLAPFVDFGYGANIATVTSTLPTATAAPGRDTLSSAGLGVIYTPNRHLNAQLYWGHPLRSFSSPGGDLQDKGIHFSLVWNLF